MIRKVCNALFESILNHNLTIKHLKITVGEYYIRSTTFPRDEVGHGIQPIRCKMLKSMDSFILSARDSIWDRVSQNHIPEVSFKLLWNRLKRELEL